MASGRQGCLRTFGDKNFTGLTLHARTGSRRRQHLNLHASFAEPSQRLLNAIEPDAYIRPHRHLLDPKPECLIALRGAFVVVVFDDRGQVTGTERIGPSLLNCLVEVPADIWHTVLAEVEGSVMFEAKSGPFVPRLAKDFAPWAPDEGSAEAAGYLDSLRAIVSKRHP